MRLYVAKEAICPFYHKESLHCIYCEGISDGSSIVLNFPDKDQKRKHKKRYCNTFEKHPTCPLFKAINEKYGRW